jgi:hypothetical protein
MVRARGGVVTSRRRLATRAALLAIVARAAVALSLGGCSDLIGLGNAATLELDGATGKGSPDGGADTGRRGSVDASSDGGSGRDAPPSCGLAPDPNPGCQACLAANCCSLARACSTDPTCVMGTACSIGCGPDVTCIGACFKTYGGDGGEKYVDYAENCGAVACVQECIVNQPTCVTLHYCCQSNQGILAPSLFAECQNTVASNAQGACTAVLGELKASAGVDLAMCTVADGG